MATSQSKDFGLTRTEIIEAALRKIGAYDSGEPVSASEEQDAAFALNLLVKEWTARGIDLFLRDELWLFPDKGTSTYTIGGPESPTSELAQSLGRNGEAATTSRVYEATATSAVAAGGSTVNMTITEDWEGGTTVGLSAPLFDEVTYRVAAELDSGRTHYGKVTATTPSIAYDQTAGTITYTYSGVGIGEVRSPLSIGNKLYFYHKRASRPTRILYAARVSDTQEVPINIIGETEYQRLTLKNQTGPTTNIWYRGGIYSGITKTTGGFLLDEGIVGKLYVWPLSGLGDTYNRIKLIAQFYADDMDAVSDNPQFPIEWANALIFNLAHDLSPEYGVDRQTRIDLYTIGQGKLNELLDSDQENANVRFTIDNYAAGG